MLNLHNSPPNSAHSPAASLLSAAPAVECSARFVPAYPYELLSDQVFWADEKCLPEDGWRTEKGSALWLFGKARDPLRPGVGTGGSPLSPMCLGVITSLVPYIRYIRHYRDFRFTNHQGPVILRPARARPTLPTDTPPGPTPARQRCARRSAPHSPTVKRRRQRVGATCRLPRAQ